MTPKSVQISPRALFRFQVVSAVEARILNGTAQSRAIEQECAQLHFEQGRPRCLSRRTLYRWLTAWRSGGIEALEDRPRPVQDRGALSPELLDFIQIEKETDGEVSIPHLLEMARLRGIVGPEESICRSTVWRACRRLGLATRRRRRLQDFARPFAHCHRMHVVLCDGKHFRAGSGRLRRVALTFLDDATRFGLDGRVIPSESALSVLLALHQVIRKWGLPTALYLDRGPGFIADDTHRVAARLGIRIILGTAGYAEGHGKIEKYHQILISRWIRGLDRDPAVDPSCEALTLRLRHWIGTGYNHRPHEGIDNDTPHERWHQDSHPLQIPDPATLRDAFVLTERRRVKKNNTLPWDGIDYETPPGTAGLHLDVHRQLVPPYELSILYRGETWVLQPTDREANALERRSKPSRSRRQKTPQTTTTSARLAFDRDHGPIVDNDGGYRGDNDP